MSTLETNKDKEVLHIQMYVRLLMYDEACALVDFINSTTTSDEYANTTVGGVSMLIEESSLDKICKFLDENAHRYEIGNEAPYKVTENIVSHLKNKGVI